MKKITAVVPVRKGSERVLSKNTRLFANTTLLDLKLEVLKNVNNIDRIVVNTDCEKSISIAKNHKIDFYRREDFFASSVVSNDVHWRHIAEVTDTDVLIMAQTTSPLIRVSTYEKAIEDFLKFDGEIGSVNSVTSEKKFFWLDGKPINYEIDKTPKSQNLPNITSLNFAISIIHRDEMMQKGNVISEKPKFIELDKIQSIDIDDLLDFDFAEYVFDKYGINWILENNIKDLKK